MPTYAQLNSSLQSKAGSQLRTFDKTINVAVTAYIRVYGTDNIWGAVMPAQNGPQSSANYSHRFEYVNASNSLYNNYLDNRIYTGSIIYSQDVIDSINGTMQRTVDQIEGRISNRSISALLCHNSCHSSCHTSRGRR